MLRYGFGIQTTSSLIVLGVLACAEYAAYLLDQHPSSETLWYINQEFFRFVGRMSYWNSPLHGLMGHGALLWILALGMAVILAYRLRSRLGIAVISNGCFMVAALVAYQFAVASGAQSVSFKPIFLAMGQGNGITVLVTVGASFLAAMLAHISYLSDTPNSRRAA